MENFLHQPNIDPVLINLWGPFQIRWYSLLFVGGFLVGRALLRKLAREDRFLFTPEDMDRFTLWLLVGAVVGARIFYCLVYDPNRFFANPFYLFQIYKGGLSFHGGLIGVVVAAILFGRLKKIPVWNILDAMSLAAPLGLAMGRLGNFINGELYGRPSEVPWAIIFRTGGNIPRHPSQLYELLLEGIVLFIVLWLLRKRIPWNGGLSAVFLIGYTLCRFFVEFFREPDSHIGYLVFGLTMGQILSLIMLGISIWLAFYLRKRAAAE